MKIKRFVLNAAIFGVIVAGGWIWYQQKKSPHRGDNATTRPTSTATSTSDAGKSVASSPNPPSTSVSAPAPSTSVSKFSGLSVKQRYYFLEELKTKDLPSIFRAMIDARAVDQDPEKQMDISLALSSVLLDRQPDLRFMQQLHEFVSDPANDRFDQQLVVGILGKAATKEAVDILADLATRANDAAIKNSAIGMLGNVGRLGGGGEKLSSTLNRMWGESSDPKLVANLATAMAEIGEARGVEMLLAAAFEEKNRTRADAALKALQKVYLPNAVPPIAAHLKKNTEFTPAADFLSKRLVDIGDATAAEALTGWLLSADDTIAPLARELVRSTRTPTMAEAWKAAASDRISFHSLKVKEAIRAGLSDFDRGRTFESAR